MLAWSAREAFLGANSIIQREDVKPEYSLPGGVIPAGVRPYGPVKLLVARADETLDAKSPQAEALLLQL